MEVVVDCSIDQQEYIEDCPVLPSYCDHCCRC
ncbi:hypothetical protein [Porticoccus sp.]